MNSINLHNYHVIVDQLLKKTSMQVTEKVYLVDEDGHRQGPYVKKLFKAGVGLGEAYSVLLNESKTSNRHNHIPQIFYVENIDNHVMILEEFCSGTTLDKYLKKQDFDIDLLNDLFLQLCRATNYLHTSFHKPVIHRDIKPSNIIVDEKSKQLKLIDFGISRNFEKDASKDTKQFGTVGYASPEQYGYKQTDIRSDVFSEGKVLEYMFDGKNWKDTKDIEVNHLYQEIIDKATSFDPKLRYRSVASVIYEYKNAMRGGSFFQRIAENKALRTIGHLWNILLTMILSFMIIVTLQTVRDPFNNSIAVSSFGEQFIYCFMTIFCICIPIWFILLYKPSIRSIIKKFPRLRFWHYLIFAVFSSSAVLVLGLLAQMLY